MSITITRGKTDDTMDRILGALARYEADHPKAEISLYRQNPVSVRVRIIDPDFESKSRPQRHDQVWKYLDELPEDTLADVSTLILLTAAEKADSFANFEFERPIPSAL